MKLKQLCVISLAGILLIVSTIVVGNSKDKSNVTIFPTIQETSLLQYSSSPNVEAVETTEVTAEVNVDVVDEVATYDEYVDESSTYEPVIEEYENNANAGAHGISSWTDEEFDMLCKIAYTEYGTCMDSYAYYIVCCVVVNRVGNGFGDTLYDVMVAPNQYLGDGYWTWDWSDKDYRNGIIEDAALLALTQNTLDPGIVYSDSMHRYDDCGYAFTYLGQDFYYR